MCTYVIRVNPRAERSRRAAALGLASSSEDEDEDKDDDPISPSSPPAPASIPTSAASIPSAQLQTPTYHHTQLQTLISDHVDGFERAMTRGRRDVPRMPRSHLICESVGSPPFPGENTASHASYSRCTLLRRSPSSMARRRHARHRLLTDDEWRDRASTRGDLCVRAFVCTDGLSVQGMVMV